MRRLYPQRYQTALAEREAVLVSPPAVAEAAVIPSPDEEHGEVPKAFVVLKTAAMLARIPRDLRHQIQEAKAGRAMTGVVPGSVRVEILSKYIT